MDSKLNRDSYRNHLPIIKCACGFEILILPDLKAMNQVIEKHVLKHKNIGATDSEANEIAKELIAQLLNKIAESDF